MVVRSVYLSIIEKVEKNIFISGRFALRQFVLLFPLAGLAR